MKNSLEFWILDYLDISCLRRTKQVADKLMTCLK